MFSVSLFQALDTHECCFHMRTYASSVGVYFVLGLVEKVLSYLNRAFYVSCAGGFFLTFVSERVSLVLGSLGVLGQNVH